MNTLDYSINVETWLSDLDSPWAIDFIDSQTALVTEQPGRLWLIKHGKKSVQPVRQTPVVLAAGQGGLLDVAIDPHYQKNGWIYLSYSHVLYGKSHRPSMTKLVRGRLRDNTWMDQQVLFQAKKSHYSTSRHHYGSRIAFDKQGYLYFSIGDRGVKQQAQDLSLPNGKIHRIHRDGRTPKDNPFVGGNNVYPSIYTYGNRNPQGLAMHPATGQIWSSEHGPKGGDELNILRSGLNYGWPEISYGINYNGTILTDKVRKPGMVQPSFYWRPSTAVCGIDFYRGVQFPKWRNKLLVTSLKYQQLSLLDIEAGRVMHEEVILNNTGRVRDVHSGPDGAVYVVLNAPDEVLIIH